MRTRSGIARSIRPNPTVPATPTGHCGSPRLGSIPPQNLDRVVGNADGEGRHVGARVRAGGHGEPEVKVRSVSTVSKAGICGQYCYSAVQRLTDSATRQVWTTGRID